MIDDQVGLIGQLVTTGGGAVAPIVIFGQTCAERPDAFEYIDICDEVCGDGEAHLLDIAALVEGEDLLEGLNGIWRAVGRRCEAHFAAGNIVDGPQFKSLRQEIARDLAVAIREDQNVAFGVVRSGVPGKGGALPWFMVKADIWMIGLKRGIQRGWAVVDDNDFNVLATAALIQRRQAQGQPVLVIVMRDDNGRYPAHQRCPTLRAGTPAKISPSPTRPRTTDPAARIAPAPMSAPGSTITPAPIHTSSAMRTVASSIA